MLNESVAVGFYQYLNEHGWSESTAFKGCITIFGVQVLW